MTPHKFQTLDLVPQALVSVLWAFAALGAPPEAALLDAAAAQLREGLGGLRPGDLATLVWALATLRHHPGDALLDAAVADAHQRLAMFSPQVPTAVGWRIVRLPVICMGACLMGWCIESTELATARVLCTFPAYRRCLGIGIA